MKDFVNSINQIYHQNTPNFKKACTLLHQYFNINRFYYFSLDNLGKLSTFWSDPEMLEQHASIEFFRAHPTICAPKHHRSGVEIIYPKQSAPINSIVQIDRFNLGLLLRVTWKSFDFVEQFTFHCPSSDFKQTLLLSNSFSSLSVFASTFIRENQHLVKDARENLLPIGDLIGADFSRNKLQNLNPLLTRNNDFFDSLGIPEFDQLSELQKFVLELMRQGHPASQIALKVCRSKRTIEHSIESIKQKLNCSSKQELLQKSDFIFSKKSQ